MNTVWSWLVVSKVCSLIRDIRSGKIADQTWTANEGAPLTVAEAVSKACAPAGLRYPKNDAHMLAVLARDGEPVALEDMPYGSAVELSNGRLGLHVNGGLVESHGEGLSLVPVGDPGRMVRAWLIPGMAYLDRVGQ